MAINNSSRWRPSESSVGFLKAQSVFLGTTIFIPSDFKESLRHWELVILNDSLLCDYSLLGPSLSCCRVGLLIFFLFNLLLLFSLPPSHRFLLFPSPVHLTELERIALALS